MTALDVDTDLFTITDWAVVLPCEHKEHPARHVPDDPAVWDVWMRCPKCQHRARYALCESGRLRMRPPHNLGCVWCGWVTSWDIAVIACHRIPEAMGGAA